MACCHFSLFLFKSTVMKHNEKLFPGKWYEKSTFPKQTRMSTLAEMW